MSTVSYTSEFTIDRPVDEVFPLMSPEGEKLWVPNWDYENVMNSTELSEDYVFVTKTHDHGTTDAVWIVKRYEPSRHEVEFYKVEPDDKVGTVNVKCAEEGDGATRVSVTYKYTAISKRGNEFVNGFSENAYHDFIKEWKQLLETYFQQERPEIN